MEWRRSIDLFKRRQSCAGGCLFSVGLPCVARHQFSFFFKSSSISRQPQCDSQHAQEDSHGRTHELEQARGRCRRIACGRGVHTPHTGRCAWRHIVLWVRSEVVYIQACIARTELNARRRTNGHLPARVSLPNVNSRGHRWNVGDQF